MRYRFSNCELDTKQQALSRDGRGVAVRPKVLKVLAYLIENADRVVSKEEILEQCWRGRVVGDATLNSCIKEARQAVGDSGDAQAILKTLHGIGYRFVARLDTQAEEPPGQAAPPPDPAPVTPLSEHEYKEVSVLACAIGNADALVDEIGIERCDEHVRCFHRVVERVLRSVGGVLCEQQDRSFIALFGAPIATEDHARRTVIAAAEIRQQTSEACEGWLSLDTGVHTGRVLTQTVSRAERLHAAVGKTTRLARELQNLSRGRLLVSAATHELIREDVSALRREIAGADIGSAFEVTEIQYRRSGVPYRGDRLHSEFVGRDAEFGIISARIGEAAAGHGQAICISGEAGIGKSRLLAEIRKAEVARGMRFLHAECLPYRQASPYYPVLQVMRQLCALRRYDPRDKVERQIAVHAARAGITDEESTALLYRLLDAGVAATADYVPKASLEQGIALTVRMLLRASEDQPVALLIEDLHWVDETTEQWLSWLIAQIPTRAVVLLASYRPGYKASWGVHSIVTQLALPRLSDRDGARIARGAAGESAAMPLLQRIVSAAQGNPFFLEELALSVSGDDGADSLQVPATVQAVLAARIDRLDTAAKSALQIAAVAGTPAVIAVLESVWPIAELTLRSCLAQLQAAELIRAGGGYGDEHVEFRHALTEAVAYDSIPQSTRRDWHSRVAEAYERSFPELCESQPELLARHLELAGRPERALDYWMAAGSRAIAACANAEAIDHFTKALAILEGLPDDKHNRERKLAVYLQIGPALMSSRAFSSPDVEQVYLRAREVCESQGDKDQLFTVIWGLWLHYSHRGLIAEARGLAAQLVELSGSLGDGYALQAHHAGWTVEIWHGDLQACLEHADTGSRLYDAVRHADHRFVFGGHDPGVCARGTAAVANWFLGFPEKAISCAREGERLAAELGHPFTCVINHLDFLVIGWLSRDAQLVGTYAARSRELCEELHFPIYLAVAGIFGGWATAKSGEHATGLEQLRAALENYRDLHADRNVTPYLLVLEELLAPDDSERESILAEAQALSERTGELRWQAEILRRRGELMLQKGGPPAAAMELFQQAIAVSNAQACLAFELRAATSLARMLHGAGDSGRALQVLDPVYRRFSEGHDTADLIDAERLLRELA